MYPSDKFQCHHFPSPVFQSFSTSHFPRNDVFLFHTDPPLTIADYNDFNMSSFEDFYYNKSCTDDQYLECENGYFENKNLAEMMDSDIMNWICYEAKNKFGQYEDIKLHSFKGVNGQQLLNWSIDDFKKCEPNFGEWLYERKSALKHCQAIDNNYVLQSDGQLPPFYNFNYENEYNPNQSKFSLSDGETSSSSTEALSTVIKRSPGRPPKHTKGIHKKAENNTGRLWEFIRNLLKSREYCPKLIKWENHDEGIFKFVQSDEVAKLWGQRKNNTKMNYEKLSRAMRYYYKSQVLLPVAGRRLVYKFGPNARDWRTKNPNFENV